MAAMVRKKLSVKVQVRLNSRSTPEVYKNILHAGVDSLYISDDVPSKFAFVHKAFKVFRQVEGLDEVTGDEFCRFLVPVENVSGRGKGKADRILPHFIASDESALEKAMVLNRRVDGSYGFSIQGGSLKSMLSAVEKVTHEFPYCNLRVCFSRKGLSREDYLILVSAISGVLLDRFKGELILASDGCPEDSADIFADILRFTGLRKKGVNVIACPTCGRCQTGVINIVERLKEELPRLDKYVEVAVMGCAVNGPGEARHADIGIAGGKGCGVLFRKGEIVGKVDEKDYIRILLEEIKKVGDKGA